jgi:hypothetical protein
MKIIFLAIILFFTTSCGRLDSVEDYALLVASGGILPLGSDGTTLCTLGLAKCPETNTTEEGFEELEEPVEPDPNKPPTLEFFVSKVEMHVGDIRNLQLKIRDKEEDNITDVYYFVEDPTLAVLEITKDPWTLNLVAKKEGNTKLRVLAKDEEENEGQSILIPLSVLNADSVSGPQVRFTSTAIEMETQSTYSIQYIYSGLSPGYNIRVKSDNKLVTTTIKKELATIVLNSRSKDGVDKLTFTFIDSKNKPYDVVVRVLVKKVVDETGGPTGVITNPPISTGGGLPIEPGEPKGPTETDTMVFNDPSACLDSSPWSNISHRYGESKNKSVSRKNSISIQSLTNNSTIKLYYKELDKASDTPFGLDINAPQIGLPLKNNTRDTERLFIIQANPKFLGSGYYYLKVKEDCYRGVFPKDLSASESEKAKYNIKLVVNDD